MKWHYSLSVVSVMALTLTACGGGGDGGTGGSAPTAAQTTVSGSVQAPNGQVAFHQPTLWDVFESSVFASLSGLTPVPDGTPVQLGRISSGGTLTSLSSATVSGGRYSFNLTRLGLTLASDLVVEVSNPATGARMRAFVTQESVDLTPMSEAGVQIVLDHILAPPGTSLSNFTIQELTDLVSAIDVLTAAIKASAGMDINSTVTTIKNQAANERQLMTFLMSAGGPGQTTEGPGDIGNYIPLDRPMSWTYQGTEQITGQPPLSYSNTATIGGTETVKGVLTTVLSETNPFNNDRSIDSYYTKDSRGVTFHGDNDTPDVLTPQLVPYLSERFPLGTGSSFEEVNRKGLDFGEDLDGDGKNEKVDILSIVTVLGSESVSVPAGLFPNCVKVGITNTLKAIASSNGATVSLIVNQAAWYAPGVGPVKRVLKIEDLTVTEELTSFTQLNAKIINLATNDLIYDPGTKRIYASVPGTPGNITPIDPTTGTTGTAIPVGNGPFKLARSDNGQFLYIGFDGEPAVQRIDITTQTASLKFSLGTGSILGSPLFAEDIEVLPGTPQSIAISRKNQGFSPRHEGVAIYDNGVQRSTTTPSHTGSNVIEFSASASRLYGYNQESTEFGFRRMTVDASGVTVLDVFDSFMGDLISGVGVDIKFDGGRIYTTSGRVIDPEARTVVGTFSGVASLSVRPDTVLGRVFFLIPTGGPTVKVSAYDLNTLQLLGSENIPGVTGTPGNLIRWGSKGLAFRTTGGQVFLVESPILIP
jgi:hypothetical protein